MQPVRCFLIACVLFLGALAQANAADWYNWRGPWQRGVSPEKDLPDKWSPDPKDKDNNLVWKAPYGCRSTPIVLNGRVYLINYTGDKETTQERVMCLDEKTGKFIKQYTFNNFFSDVVTVRLGWTHLAGDPKTGYIYAHGTSGLFFCFDKDLNVVWSRSLTEEYGRLTGYGGRIPSPTIGGELVIMGMLNNGWGDQGKGANRFLAMNKRTGEAVWWMDAGLKPDFTYYSVPVVAVINGQALVISGSGEGHIYAMKLETGEKVWGYKFSALAVNCSPVVDGNLVYIGHGDENPDNSDKGRVICLDASQVKDGQPKLVWQRDRIRCRYSTPIVNEGKIYVPDEEGNLHCLDSKTGKTLWKYHYSRGSRGSPVWADGKIYVTEADARFHILKPEATKCITLNTHFFPAPPGVAGVELNGTPAVANGCVFFATEFETFCIGKKGATPAPEPPVFQVPVPKRDKPAEPAHLQIVPADVVVYPGDVVAFTLRSFDKNGYLIKEEKAGKWQLPAPPAPPGSKSVLPALDGTIVDGKLTVSKSKDIQAGYVTATLGGLTGKARVRVVPRLPYVADFSKMPDGSVPPGWVNAKAKFVIKTYQGEKVFAKINNDIRSIFARGYTYIGKPTEKDYTIQCDVLGTKVGNDLPDIGIIASRYTLEMKGNIDKLRLVTWDPLPRIDKTVDYPWKPGVWYRLKLTVVQEGAKCVAKGKIWEPAKDEPADWTVTVTDTCPNREGSPALYGSVTGIPADGKGAGTEILFKNLRVTPNKP